MSEAQVTIENGQFFIRFSYDPSIIATIKSCIPSAQFSNPYKAWIVPMTAISYAQMCKALQIRVPEVERWLRQRKKTVDLSTWKFKTQPMAHQIEGVKFLLNKFGVEVK